MRIISPSEGYPFASNNAHFNLAVTRAHSVKQATIQMSFEVNQTIDAIGLPRVCNSEARSLTLPCGFRGHCNDPFRFTFRNNVVQVD